MISIRTVSNVTLHELFNRSPVAGHQHGEELLKKCVAGSVDVRYGYVNGQCACVWGLIPPTLLSSSAYLWLLTTDLVEQHKFLFVRYSRRWVEDALKRYPRLIGDVVCGEGADSTQRWLGLLGAKFLSPINNRIPFEIRADNG